MIYQQDAVYKSIDQRLNRSITTQSTRGTALAVLSQSPQKADVHTSIILTFRTDMKIQSGKISQWDEDKGFGFITPKSGGKTIFFHINAYSRFHKRPLKGLEVRYFESSDNKGRKCAIDVCPLKGHKNNKKEVMQKVFSTVLLCVFACFLYYLNISKSIPIELVCLYAAMSALTFFLYLKDKSAAECGRWRTPESTLHTLSLLGGWPGASIAQSFLRHKSKKLSFRVKYWVTVIANCGALYLIVTPKGGLWLKSLLRNLNFG